MNPQYTNVKVEGPSFPTKGQPVMFKKRSPAKCLIIRLKKTNKNNSKQFHRLHQLSLVYPDKPQMLM